jgi:hypothetical protein
MRKFEPSVFVAQQLLLRIGSKAHCHFVDNRHLVRKHAFNAVFSADRFRYFSFERHGSGVAGKIPPLFSSE